MPRLVTPQGLVSEVTSNRSPSVRARWDVVRHVLGIRPDEGRLRAARAAQLQLLFWVVAPACRATPPETGHPPTCGTTRAARPELAAAMTALLGDLLGGPSVDLEETIAHLSDPVADPGPACSLLRRGLRRDDRAGLTVVTAAALREVWSHGGEVRRSDVERLREMGERLGVTVPAALQAIATGELGWTTPGSGSRHGLDET